MKLRPEASYFGIEAYLGATKHGGSVVSTRDLVELCRITQDSLILDVGCGVGATACFLAKKMSCRVIGVDIRTDMVLQARKRAERNHLVSRAEFQIADAQELPFKDGTFDAVLSESVTLFVDDRSKAMKEYVRVVKSGGYVGLNEEVWLRTPVPPRLVDYMKRGVELSGEVPTPEYWRTLMENASLQKITTRIYSQMGWRELSRLRRYNVLDLIGASFRFVGLLIKRPDVRSWIKQRVKPPLNLGKYLGYGLYVGKKSS